MTEPNTGIIPPPPNESRIFALLIGINEYKYSPTGIKKQLLKLNPFKTPLKDLNGCVADAEAMKEYLVNNLGASSTRIQTLFNDQATRENIKRHIQQLAHTDEIRKGDPILIFFAGHGSLTKPPSGWDDSRQEISIILPHDFNPGSSSDSDRLEQGLPQFVLDTLFVNLARAKGNNITVIFDCCHSGSGLREGPDEDDENAPMERGVMLDPSDGYKMTEGQDEDVAVQGAVEKAASNEGSLNGSYVRLSACWSTETARESNKSGHFTSALLKRLRLDDGPKLTYAQLIRGLGPLEGQRPQCEGANSSYIVFQGRPQTLLPLSYLVTSSGPFVRVSAGEADGVTKGDRFDIFADGMPIETAIVSDSPTAFTSDLDIDADKFNELTASAQSVCAVQSRIASKPKFRVYLATSDPNSGICSQLEQQVARLAAADDMRSIVSVLHGEPADMIIRIDVGEDGRHHATFELHHALLPQPIHLHSPAPATHQAVYRVMTAAADFYWHLDRTSGNKGKIANSIQVDLHRLKPMAPGTNMKTVKGTKLIPGEAIDYDGSEEFGLTVSCRSGLSLHVAAFFFNLSTLSIEPLFLPPIALNQDVEPTLNKKEKSLPIGYQSSGWPPLTFSFPESVSVGDTVNVGFIKVFLCHDYVEYERIIQGSPFKDLSAFDHLSNVTDALDFGKGLDTSPDGEPLSGGRPRGSLLSKLFNVFSSSTFSYFRNGSSAYDWDTVTRLVTLRRT